MVGSEMGPFSKTGGLGDVMGALPGALARLGCDVTAMIPYLPSMAAHRGIEPTGVEVEVQIDGSRRRARVLESRLEGGVRVLLIDYPPYFDREALYGTAHGDYEDNAQRFAFFCYAAIEAGKAMAPGPDVVQAHDWQAALVPFLLRAPEHYGDDPAVVGTFTVQTIHNLAYQGVFPKTVLPGLGIAWSHFHLGELEFYDHVNFLKAGLTSADQVTTVSPTYAREIQSAANGWGLDGVLTQRAKQGALVGILNGIDTESWDPAADEHLATRYAVHTLHQRKGNTAALRLRMGLPPADAPVVGMVTRLAEQKGIDLLLELGDRMGALKMQWAILGSGDHRYETAIRDLARKYPDRVSVRIGFEEGLARLIYAGSDFFCMPSLFEPCGLGQLIALRYGSLPIVRETGGLADTVVDVRVREGSGIVFGEPTTQALEKALRRARSLFDKPGRLNRAREIAMSRDFSWGHSAHAYLKLFQGEGVSVPDTDV
jgi:starch synthase